MAEVYNFPSSTWDTKGSVIPIKAETQEDGRLLPKVRVIDPGLGDKKSGGYLYLMLHGVIEDSFTSGIPIGRTFSAFPLGVGISESSPDALLRECLSLNIVVRRTAGVGEKLVYYNTTPLNLLEPWAKVLNHGSIFAASQICNAVNLIPLDIPQRFRPVYLTITRLSDEGVYYVPRSLQEFRLKNAIAFNILIVIAIRGDLDHLGIQHSARLDHSANVTFLMHIGNFKRKRGKLYSYEYCKQKIQKMGLQFGLGGIGGLSIHVRVTGKMSKTLKAHLGFRRNICFPLMFVNEGLNRQLWRAECSIQSIQAILQPSVPAEFKFYDNIIIDNTDGIMRIV